MAKKRFVVDLDLDQNELQNAVVEQLAVAPSSPVQGQLYYDTTNDNVYVYDGSGWVDLTAGAGGGDMSTGVYDPQNIADDAFDTDNHTSGTTNKVFTATEQSKLAGVEINADVTSGTKVISALSGATVTSTTVAGDDKVLIQDTDNLNAMRYVTAQDIADLGVTGGAVTSVNGQTGVAVLDPDDLDDSSTTNKFITATALSKLGAIEDNADVTDATNVASAGAVMEADTSTASMSFVIDEDNMVSDSATKVPTQQSVKAYVDASSSSSSGVSSQRAITQTAHGFDVGDVLYLDGGDYALAQADDVATADVVGIVIEDTDANNFVLLTHGWTGAVLSGLTAGTSYFLSAGTPGLLTSTEPSAPNISKPLLVADTTTSGYFFNWRGSIDSPGSGGVDVSGTPVANDFARFTDADTIEGRSYSEVRADLDLEIGTDVMAYAANNATSSSTNTFTNKTFDANGTGNSISNLEVADFAATAIVTAAETLASSDNDTSVPTTAAVIDAIAAVGGISDGDKGDITVSAGGTTWTVDNDAVTYAKIQNVSATDRILGRSTAGSGDVEEITFTDQAQQLCDDTSFTAMATTLGLGTGNSPQFTAINLGHASDTTIARASAGNITVEGNAIYRAGGTDVPVTDGGTGASDAPTARTNLGVGTGDSPEFTAVNIGAATDTTIARVSAGVISVEGITVPTVSSTNTLTNKRWTKRVLTTASSGTPTLNTDSYDVHRITAQAAAITNMSTNLTGTPTDSQSLIISITDSGTARAITWGTSFEASGTIALPTTTVISTRLDIAFLWNSVTSKWRIMGYS